MKSLGSFAARRCSPGSRREHRRLDRARRVRPGGRRGGDERRLDLARGPASGGAGAAARRRRRRAAQPCSSRRRRRTGRRRSPSVDERIWPPGAPTSGFSWWPKAVSPPEEKLVTMPLRPVTSSCGSGRSGSPSGLRVPPGRSAAPSRRRRRSSRPGRRAATGMPFASPAGCRRRRCRSRRRRCTRAAFSANVQTPRETSAIAPVSEPAGSGVEPPLRFPGGPQRLRGHRSAVAPISVPTSTSCWSRSPSAGGASPGPDERDVRQRRRQRRAR